MMMTIMMKGKMEMMDDADHNPNYLNLLTIRQKSEVEYNLGLNN